MKKTLQFKNKMPLGDITAKQLDLKNRLESFRSKVKFGKGGFCESKDENTITTSMTKALQEQLEHCLDEEMRDKKVRAKEKHELMQLKAENLQLKEKITTEEFRVNSIKSSLTKTQTRLSLAMENLNEVNFEKSIVEQKLNEWRRKIKTHVSNVKEMESK